MNCIKNISTLALICLLFIACKEKITGSITNTTTETVAATAKKDIPKSNLQTASFTIKGMTCAIGCAKTIQEELNGLSGVKTATVDFEKELATVSYDKTILSPQKLTKVVEATADGKSYKVSNINL